MENFENKPKIEGRESTPEFHFREIAEIESAMASLVRQLKEKIENGELALQEKSRNRLLSTGIFARWSI